MTLAVDAAFDGGNIEVLDARDPGDVRLAIRQDRYSPYFQWFAFRILGARGIACRMQIVNAGASSYAGGWRNGYRAAVSQDRVRWHRIDTVYDGTSDSVKVVPS